jgi:hypothetical protein
VRPRVHELRYRLCTLQAGLKLTTLNRRKFFSSHEKLILEKRAVADQTSELASGSTSRAGSAIPFRHFHSHRRACTVDTQPQEPQFTQEEAAFFLSLPDKVRKQLYSREEQVVILAKAEQALDEAAAIEQRLHEFSFPWSTATLKPHQKLTAAALHFLRSTLVALRLVFIPSPGKSRTQKVACSFSTRWMHHQSGSRGLQHPGERCLWLAHPVVIRPALQ